MNEVAVLVGSLRAESINRKLAIALSKLRPERLNFNIVLLHHVPLYNQELETELPAGVVELKQKIESSDAVLLVTPEYNRSVPGVLKNAIDWGTRPRGRNSFAGKPAAIVGASDGRLGTSLAQAHLRSILPILGVALLSQPEVYYQWKPDGIDETGALNEESARMFLGKFLDRFADWIEKFGEKR